MFLCTLHAARTLEARTVEARKKLPEVRRRRKRLLSAGFQSANARQHSLASKQFKHSIDGGGARGAGREWTDRHRELRHFKRIAFKRGRECAMNSAARPFDILQGRGKPGERRAHFRSQRPRVFGVIEMRRPVKKRRLSRQVLKRIGAFL